MTKGLKIRLHSVSNLVQVMYQRICLGVGNDFIYTLLFADDQTLIAEEREDITYMV